MGAAVPDAGEHALGVSLLQGLGGLRDGAAHQHAAVVEVPAADLQGVRERGMIDLVIDRREMKATIGQVLRFMHSPVTP